ncbi:MAG TPA: hypothetical protein PLZ16_13755, partial [Gammaproteobacteria bacterium]|nr:hypothetical protein [Gammaproteobacteria bacterium]
PHLALREYEALYPLDKLVPYPMREGELEEKARRFYIKWRGQKADTADEEGRRRYMAIYYAMITFVDEMVGKLMAELTAQGLIQIDHGGAVGRLVELERIRGGLGYQRVEPGNRDFRAGDESCRIYPNGDEQFQSGTVCSR